jgi:hypothetical protein
MKEFKKLVYDSKFKKLAEWMSFVNSRIESAPPPKYHAGRAPDGSENLPLFRDLSGKRCYTKLSISSKCAILVLCIFLLTQASFSPQ